MSASDPKTETTVSTPGEGEPTTPTTPTEEPKTEAPAEAPKEEALKTEEPGKAEEPKTPEDEPLREEGKKALQAERDANKALRDEFDAYKQTAVAKDDHDKALAELEELRKERDELKKTSAERSAKDDLLEELRKAGARKPAVALRLLDISKYDAEKKNGAELVKQLADDPDTADQFGPVEKDGLGNQDGPSGGKGKQRHFTEEEVERMSVKEYEANRAEIFASMKSWK